MARYEHRQTEAQTVTTPPEKHTTSLKQGECPLCGSEDIRSGEAVLNKEGIRGGNRLPIDIQFAVPIDNFICLGCGYVESYILDRSILKRIENQWRRVLPNQSKDNLT